jgi:hypothetical protein
MKKKPQPTISLAEGQKRGNDHLKKAVNTLRGLLGQPPMDFEAEREQLEARGLCNLLEDLKSQLPEHPNTQLK